ncbi:MAG: hypothetical protein LBD78_09685 [Spirochaetaceae bacterium]|jgi:hypothetical protein|nr:hypothetical protein [Spirochaetaceae bacterium]
MNYNSVDQKKWCTHYNMGGLYRGDGHKMGLWAGAAWQKTFALVTG